RSAATRWQPRPSWRARHASQFLRALRCSSRIKRQIGRLLRATELHRTPPGAVSESFDDGGRRWPTESKMVERAYKEVIRKGSGFHEFGQVETVAHPGFGQKVSGSGRVFLDLFAQLVDKGAQVFDLIPVIGAPDCLQESCVRDGDVGMGHEIVQQIKLLRCETDFALSYGDPARCQVDLHVFESDDLGPPFGRERGSAKSGADPGHQFGRAERLGYIVVGSGIQSRYFVLLRVSHG